jgi:hypothetical protein
MVKLEISRFPCKGRLCMPGSQTTPDRRTAAHGSGTIRIANPSEVNPSAADASGATGGGGRTRDLLIRGVQGGPRRVLAHVPDQIEINEAPASQ